MKIVHKDGGKEFSMATAWVRQLNLNYMNAMVTIKITLHG